VLLVIRLLERQPVACFCASCKGGAIDVVRPAGPPFEQHVATPPFQLNSRIAVDDLEADLIVFRCKRTEGDPVQASPCDPSITAIG
jgi:hypothetical protein